MIPSIRQRSQNAVTVDRIDIKFYQQMNSGRMCSCYKKEFDAPEANCLICFGSGRVGGYNVYGTYLDVIDTTKENITTVNVKINDEVWPWRFELIDDTLEGYVDALIDVPSMRSVDIIKLYNSGNYIKCYVRKSTDTAWHRLNRSSIMSLSSVDQQLVIRIILYRKTVDNTTPNFTHLYLRYNIIDKNIYADMPKIEELTNMDNFALTGLQTTQAFITSDIPSVSIQDFYKDLRRDHLWKVVHVTRNDPLGILTSWDLEVRSIESFEIYNEVP